tara:strand:- start:49 stop:378 length:330 start_codon:yes stop_codon:yes gene_type:complete
MKTKPAQGISGFLCHGIQRDQIRMSRHMAPITKPSAVSSVPTFFLRFRSPAFWAAVRAIPRSRVLDMVDEMDLRFASKFPRTIGDRLPDSHGIVRENVTPAEVVSPWGT